MRRQVVDLGSRYSTPALLPDFAHRLLRPTLIDDFEQTMRLLGCAPSEVFRQKLHARVRVILLHRWRVAGCPILFRSPEKGWEILFLPILM